MPPCLLPPAGSDQSAHMHFFCERKSKSSARRQSITGFCSALFLSFSFLVPDSRLDRHTDAGVGVHGQSDSRRLGGEEATRKLDSTSCNTPALLLLVTATDDVWLCVCQSAAATRSARSGYCNLRGTTLGGGVFLLSRQEPEHAHRNASDQGEATPCCCHDSTPLYLQPAVGASPRLTCREPTTCCCCRCRPSNEGWSTPARSHEPMRRKTKPPIDDATPIQQVISTPAKLCPPDPVRVAMPAQGRRPHRRPTTGGAYRRRPRAGMPKITTSQENTLASVLKGHVAAADCRSLPLVSAPPAAAQLAVPTSLDGEGRAAAAAGQQGENAGGWAAAATSEQQDIHLCPTVPAVPTPGKSQAPDARGVGKGGGHSDTDEELRCALVAAAAPTFSDCPCCELVHDPTRHCRVCARRNPTPHRPSNSWSICLCPSFHNYAPTPRTVGLRFSHPSSVPCALAPCSRLVSRNAPQRQHSTCRGQVSWGGHRSTTIRTAGRGRKEQEAQGRRTPSCPDRGAVGEMRDR